MDVGSSALAMGLLRRGSLTIRELMLGFVVLDMFFPLLGSRQALELLFPQELPLVCVWRSSAWEHVPAGGAEYRQEMGEKIKLKSRAGGNRLFRLTEAG